MIIPASLKNGDIIAIASPAAAMQNPGIVEKSAQEIDRQGFRVKKATHCMERHGYYAGTIRQRADDMLSLLADDSVKAILCSYGGYGCVHLLEEFTPAISEHPKWIIGMSDCSALHAGCISAGVASLHAPQCRHLAERPDDKSTQILFDILRGKAPCYHVEHHPLNVYGKARGMLVGGNLSVLCSLLRTPYDIFRNGTILFIEDVNEPPYRIERMMYNLKLAGILGNLSGIIVGQFTDARHGNASNSDIYNAIHALTADYGLPVCFDFPVGHVQYNMPLIEGVEATLEVTPDGTRLSVAT